ncbi:hypothetical protein GCM10009785_27260 [Brooklawnia cerclae]|uniref:DUF2752 domain-containing protein n=1 Tax=Brooklawnia cerclae TaxID=349934 RepID=A0ABX0SF28_9ACTN|nr:DUF2752 domain-containing protein [Brooklawnia cerclae]NIH56982.1 hypothetical protein [Brooklawnia cerclae]
MATMSAPAPVLPAFSARRALTRLGAFVLVGGAIAAAHAVLGVGVPCPFRELTGLQCPLCGSTRAALRLTRGDVASAWSLNALFVVAVGVLIVCGVVWAVEALGGPAVRPPRWARPLLRQNRLYVIVGVIGVVFAVVRNIV